MKQLKWIYAVHAFFFIACCLVSFVNHYLFRTYAHDLGIANQALYEFAHFKNHYSTLLLRPDPTHYLGLHVGIWVPLLSPFYYVFGSYTLLLFQNIAIVFCAIGIYKYAQTKQLSNAISTLIVVQFYCIWSLYTAVAFDFHDTVMAIAFVPWLFMSYAHKKWIPFALCFAAILLSKENESIWLIGILLGLIVKHKQYSFKQNKVALGFGFIAIAWFCFCSFIFMPYLSPTGNFEQLSRYSHLGQSIGEIIYTTITNPLYVFKQFFVSNAPNDPDTIYKTTFYVTLLASGALAFVIRPYYLLMILPLLAQKMLSKVVSFWGVNQHYSIEFAPLLTLAVIDVLILFRQTKWQGLITVALIITSFTATYSKMFSAKHTYIAGENLFEPVHYQSPVELSKVYEVIDKIDNDIPLSVSAQLAPHLYKRALLYHFPIVHNAAKIVLLKGNQTATYPLYPQNYFHKLDSLKQSNDWKIEIENNEIIVFKRP
ncbi:MAG: DUF2079 domain-containing protein [Bacteroidota bacterium]